MLHGAAIVFPLSWPPSSWHYPTGRLNEHLSWRLSIGGRHGMEVDPQRKQSYPVHFPRLTVPYEAIN